MSTEISYSQNHQNTNSAKDLFENLKRRFSKSFSLSEPIDPDYMLEIELNSAGRSTVYNLKEVSYIEHDFIVFNLEKNGKKVLSIQHVSQVNFLLTKFPKA